MLIRSRSANCGANICNSVSESVDRFKCLCVIVFYGVKYKNNIKDEIKRVGNKMGRLYK